MKSVLISVLLNGLEMIGIWWMIGAVYIGYYQWQERKKPKSLFAELISSMPWYSRWFQYGYAFLVGPLLWMDLEIERQVQEADRIRREELLRLIDEEWDRSRSNHSLRDDQQNDKSA